MIDDDRVDRETIGRAALLEKLDGLARAQRLLRMARERLDEIARLDDDWDSYGAARPTARAVSTAHLLLASLFDELAESADEQAIPWTMAPLADGGVQAEWRGPGGAIEVEISPDGLLNFLVEQDERTVRRSDPRRGEPAEDAIEQVRFVLGSPAERSR